MRTLYSLALYVLAPFVFLRLAWRSLRAPDYRKRWSERLGFYGAATPPIRDAIWLHAVSVGEVQASVPLVRALLERYGEGSLVLTTTTPTGSRRVQDLFGSSVTHVYVPYDLPGAVSRFLRRFKPRLGVIMETEIWPNLFAMCDNAGVPLLVANARLSMRSARGYSKIRPLIRNTLSHVSMLAAQGDADARRFRILGLPPQRTEVTGSIKFEQRLPASLREQAEVLRGLLGRDRPVWIAASTHEGEDEQVLDAFEQLLQRLPDSLLVLVPRHPERFGRVAALCRKRGYTIALRSANEACDEHTQIYLGDTLGELPLLYSACDVAFVGGSFTPVGGHNMLEPAALGLPSLTGPHIFNFTEIATMLMEVGAARLVQDSGGLARHLELLLRDANLRHAMGEQGKRLVEANRGALERLLQIIEQLLQPRPPGYGPGEGQYARIR